MLDNIYGRKMVSYAQQLAKQFNSKVGKVGMQWGHEENAGGTSNLDIARLKKTMGVGTGPNGGYDRHYLEITPELIEAVKTGRLKFYRRGGLVTKNTYRRGGLVSRSGYRKNMSRLGFQDGGYAQ